MKKITFLLILILTISNAYAQSLKDKQGVSKHEGYISFYYDDSEDKLFLEVNKLNHEFLYVNALSEGLGSNDIGLDRGQLGDGVVVKFKKAGNKLLLIQTNQNYRAITDNIEEKKSVKKHSQNLFYTDLL